jgi:hypothetical protein
LQYGGAREEAMSATQAEGEALMMAMTQEPTNDIDDKVDVRR